MPELNKLEPSIVWKHFEKLCNIPRPSKHESAAIEYVCNFAKTLGLEYKTDLTGNVVIRKPASKGLENLIPVVLQAHLDMVPQKNSDKEHDFTKDPIQPYVEGAWVKARGTTLGADNGIGVAAALAILESNDYAHGPLEALFTIDEETGMTGAFNLNHGFFQGKILMNLDSEEYGEIIIGCAGGINTSATFKFKKEPVSGNIIAYKLSLTGLKGGHSGVDIHLGRGNSNKLLNRFMWNADHFFDMRLCSISGGSLRNAIPRESFAIVTIPAQFEEEFVKSIKNFEHIYREELASVEDNLYFSAEKTKLPEYWIEKQIQERLLDSLYAAPNGVIRVIPEMPDVVETSTNLAIVQSSDEGIIEVKNLIRSSVDSAKRDLCNMVESIFDMAQAETIHDGDYPGWKPNFKSPVLQTMKNVYSNIHGSQPEVKIIHAGLECGIIGDVYPGLDMVSFGPTIKYPHSPDEKVEIESVAKFWKYLTEVLKSIPTA